MKIDIFRIFLLIHNIHSIFSLICKNNKKPISKIIHVTWSDGELDWGFEDETIIVTQPIKTYINYPYLSHENKLKFLKNTDIIKDNVFDIETIYNDINDIFDNIISNNIEYIQYLPPLLIPSVIIIILIEQKSIEINNNFLKKLLFFFIILFFKSPKQCL